MSGRELLSRLSRRWRWDDLEEGGALVFFTRLAVALTVGVVALALLQAAVQDPIVIWGLLLLVMGLFAAFLVWHVLPRQEPGHDPDLPLGPRKQERSASERELIMLANAMEGSPNSQLMAYLTLRGMLVRRYMLLRHLLRVEAEADLGDPTVARRELKDERLVWLASHDFKRAYEPERLKTEEAQRMVREFRIVFPELLEKVEGLR